MWWLPLSACRWYDRSGQVLVFITELLTDGSLRRFIRRKHAAGITLSALKRYAWQILQGLVYLHGHYPPIIHRCETHRTAAGREGAWDSAVTGTGTWQPQQVVAAGSRQTAPSILVCWVDAVCCVLLACLCAAAGT